MKRISRRFISIITILSILVSSVFVMTASADDVVVETYDSCADQYFSELKGNVPKNVVGSCAYVATSMLLAYYDTYWNDNFVPDEYEASTAYPEGVESGYSTIKTENELWDELDEEYGGTLSESDFADLYYEDFVEQHLNEGYLHLDLIKIGIDLGLYEEGEWFLYHDPYGANLDESAYILEEYLCDIFGDYNYYDYFGANSVLDTPPLIIKIMRNGDLGVTNETVIQKMYELVDAGIPVMYRGSNGTGGHRMIAYDTIKEDGQIVDCILHTGWTSGYYTTLSQTEYDEDISILWLEIDETRIPHVCSNNFLLNNGTSACSCNVYASNHPEHIHSSTLVSNTDTAHTYECDWCGHTTVECHLFTYNSVSNMFHEKRCFCGKVITERHVMLRESAQYSVCTICRYRRDHFGGNENVHLGYEEETPSE